MAKPGAAIGSQHTTMEKGTQNIIGRRLWEYMQAKEGTPHRCMNELSPTMEVEGSE